MSTLLIAPNDVRAMIEFIDRSGAAELLDALVRTDHRGRSRPLSSRTFLVGTLLSVHEGGSMLVNDIYSVLTESIPLDLRAELDLCDPDGQNLLSKTQLDYYIKTMRRQINHTPDYQRIFGFRLEPAEVTRRRNGVDAVVQGLLDASLYEDGEPITRVAVDETAIASWKRPALRRADPAEDTPPDGHDEHGKRLEERQPSPAPDPDAYWGVKTKTVGGGREPYFGYSMHAITTTRSTSGEAARPLQALAIRTTPASTEIVDVTLEMIDQVKGAHPAVEELLADRHYSYKAANRWALPLIGRGIFQVMDMHGAEQKGFTDFEGAPVADGTPHCPSTPDALGLIKRPKPGSNKEEFEAFAATIDERRRYAMKRMTLPNAAGQVRYQCPALAGTAGCPLRAGTVQAANEANALTKASSAGEDHEIVPVVVNPPEASTAPKCCTQKTFTTDASIIKQFQRHYWGSKEWTKTYNKRTYVEGFFGILKGSTHEDVGRDTFRLSGLATHALFLGIAVASNNLRAMERWYSENSEEPRPTWVIDPNALAPAVITQEELARLQRRDALATAAGLDDQPEEAAA